MAIPSNAISSNAIRESLAVGKAITGHHWRVWEWCNGRLERFLSGRPVHQPQSLQHLWQMIQNGQILEGDYIDFRSHPGSGTFWHIQEWVPRAPGALWHQDGLFSTTPDEIALGLTSPFALPREMRNQFSMYSAHAHWEGQFIDSAVCRRSLQDQGFCYRLGCYRPAVSSDPGRHALLGVTTAKEFLADLAFPVVLPEPAYLKFIRNRASEHTSVEFEGRIRVGAVCQSDGFSGYIASAGAQPHDALRTIIEDPMNVSRFVGQVLSPLDFECRTNDTHPFVTVRVDGWNIDADTLGRGVVMICRNSVINPCDKMIDLVSGGNTVTADEVRFSLPFLLRRDHQFGTEIQPITDFDGQVCRFQSQLWVGANPALNPTILKSVRNPAIAANATVDRIADTPDETWLL